jgi:glycosyltransferase involved in cell wall biosynthesis
LFVKLTVSDIKDKLVVIPNGIDNYFLANQYPKKDIIKAKNFLYIGDFSSNKNIIFIIKAFENLQLFYPDINLNLVGGGGRIEGNQEKDIIEYVNNNTSINYLGKIFDRRQLSSVMRENDVFIMVSHGETFGLVYIEALSQGLPIIYTKGQGVDGFFDDMNVGEKADSKSIDSIYNAMKKMIEDYPSYENIGDKINQFTWENNSKMIMNCINNII